MRFHHAVLVGLLGFNGSAFAAEPPSATVPPSTVSQHDTLFDPSRHMSVAEVKPGMIGYGLSVFSGSKIERFDVEVISVLRNFNPKYDVILIKCRGQNLEHSGAVAGMSGSPIYLEDEQGKERMVGAFAYGWPMSKDPIAGVQPIEYMLTIPATPKPGASDASKSVAGGSDNGPSKPAGAEARGRWSMGDALAAWDRYAHPGQRGAQPLASSILPAAKTQGDPAMQLQPLTTPLMTAGASPKILEQFGPLFTAQGLTLLQSGGSGKPVDGEPTPKLEPGSVLAVPMLIGDVDMTAIGTTTEVLNGQVWGFGHPFNNEGQVKFPMGAGTINHIVSTLSTSFKLGAMSEPAGTLTADRSVGIAGKIGPSPQLAPIDLKVTYADGSPDVNYHFDSAVHPRFSPLLAGMAITSALSGVNELPQYNTIDYDIALQFSNGKSIKLSDTVANAAGMDLFRFIGMPLLTAADNPFERVLVSKVCGEIRISPEPKLSQITDVNLPRSKYRPGEIIKAYVEVKRFRGGEEIVPVELELPKDLREGNYQLVISDWTRFMQDEQKSKPFRFTGENIDELFDALHDFTSIRQNALYVRLVRAADGIAIGRTAMPKLPSSRRQMLLGAGRSGTTRFVSSTTQTVPMDSVMQGAAEFVISIDADAKVEIGKPGAPMPADKSGDDAGVAPVEIPAAPPTPIAPPEAQPPVSKPAE